MAKRTRPTAADFTVAELKAMLAAKTQIDELESRRGELLKELDKVERALAKLLAGGGTLRKPARKKAAKKVAKKSAKKSSRRKATKKTAPTKSRPTIESVIVDMLTNKGESMALKDILAEIQSKKLVTTKATDFANVLRRTVSTSKVIKRVGRGMYSI